MSTSNPTLHELSCADDYDPNSMPVPKAREVIARFLSPVATIERVSVRAALGRVLADDVISPVDVPSHDNRRWTVTPCALPISRPKAKLR